MATEADAPAVGTRFSQGPHRGTVRYVGEVPSTRGIWLGVEWDDAGRGKHDGTHDGVRYFACRVPGSGSFIRPTAKISFGSSFLQALRHKYVGEEQHETMAASTNARQYTRKTLADIEVEAPNMNGVRQRTARLDRLRDVGLGGWKMVGDPEAVEGAKSAEAESFSEVARAFDHAHGEKEGDIRSVCPNIRWLDLSRSLLPTWTELARITMELPYLDTLILHFNRFASYDGAHVVPKNSFLALRDLRLDGTMITWPEVRFLTARMPVLENLQLGANQLTTLGRSSSEPSMKRLRQLNLADNQLSDWTMLMASLRDCPQLQRLILSGNRVSHIPLCEGEPLTQVRHISIADNSISSWSDLDNLDAWVDGLEALVITPASCPFLTLTDESDIRPILIARMASLETLNHAPITASERRDAELFYLSTIERETVNMDEQERQKLHSRWSTLSQKHGRAPIRKPLAGDGSARDGKITLRSKLLPIRILASTAPPTQTTPFVTQPLGLSIPPEGVEVSLLISTPLRLLQGKIARSLGFKRGPKAIRSIWALLSPQIDPSQDTARQLRMDMRPDSSDKGTADEERIVYQLDNLEWDLAGYNFSHGDQLVVVVAE